MLQGRVPRLHVGVEEEGKVAEDEAGKVIEVVKAMVEEEEEVVAAEVVEEEEVVVVVE